MPNICQANFFKIILRFFFWCAFASHTRHSAPPVARSAWVSRYYSNPRSVKLKYSSSPTMMWSRILIPMISPASFSLLVIAISPDDGAGSPVGCWCTSMIAAAFDRQAVLKTSRGWTMLWLRLPMLTKSRAMILFLPSRWSVRNISFVSFIRNLNVSNTCEGAVYLVPAFR